MGQVEEGLTVLAKAQAIVSKNGGYELEAELYRLKGELTLQQVVNQKSKSPDPRSLTPDLQGEAEACFLKAIEIAQRQQAKSLELRAVVSLVRLRQHHAQNPESCNTDHASRTTQHEARTRLNEAHDMLSEIYNWFTEGFDTKDLQEAQALLAELSH